MFVPSGPGVHDMVVNYSGDVNYQGVTLAANGYQNSLAETVS